MHCTTEILRQWPILVKDCLCERLSPQRSLLMPLLLLLLYLNSWISFSVPFVLTMQQLSLRCKFVHFSTHPNRMTTSCGPATIGKLVANSVCAMHKKPVYGCSGYCCYFPRIFILWVLFVPHVHLPLHSLRVPFFCIFCVCVSFVSELLPQLTEASIWMSASVLSKPNKREMIRKSIKQKHVFITHQCKHRLCFDGIQLNRSLLLSS